MPQADSTLDSDNAELLTEPEENRGVNLFTDTDLVSDGTASGESGGQDEIDGVAEEVAGTLTSFASGERVLEELVSGSGAEESLLPTVQLEEGTQPEISDNPPVTELTEFAPEEALIASLTKIQEDAQRAARSFSDEPDRSEVLEVIESLPDFDRQASPFLSPDVWTPSARVLDLLESGPDAPDTTEKLELLQQLELIRQGVVLSETADEEIETSDVSGEPQQVSEDTGAPLLSEQPSAAEETEATVPMEGPAHETEGAASDDRQPATTREIDPIAIEPEISGALIDSLERRARETVALSIGGETPRPRIVSPDVWTPSDRLAQLVEMGPTEHVRQLLSRQPELTAAADASEAGKAQPVVTYQSQEVWQPETHVRDLIVQGPNPIIRQLEEQTGEPTDTSENAESPLADDVPGTEDGDSRVEVSQPGIQVDREVAPSGSEESAAVTAGGQFVAQLEQLQTAYRNEGKIRIAPEQPGDDGADPVSLPADAGQDPHSETPAPRPDSSDRLDDTSFLTTLERTVSEVPVARRSEPVVATGQEDVWTPDADQQEVLLSGPADQPVRMPEERTEESVPPSGDQAASDSPVYTGTGLALTVTGTAAAGALLTHLQQLDTEHRTTAERPTPDVVTIEDNTGQSGSQVAKVVRNRAPVVLEEQWTPDARAMEAIARGPVGAHDPVEKPVGDTTVVSAPLNQTESVDESGATGAAITAGTLTASLATATSMPDTVSVALLSQIERVNLAYREANQSETPVEPIARVVPAPETARIESDAVDTVETGFLSAIEKLEAGDTTELPAPPQRPRVVSEDYWTPDAAQTESLTRGPAGADKPLVLPVAEVSEESPQGEPRPTATDVQPEPTPIDSAATIAATSVISTSGIPQGAAFLGQLELIRQLNKPGNENPSPQPEILTRNGPSASETESGNQPKPSGDFLSLLESRVPKPETTAEPDSEITRHRPAVEGGETWSPSSYRSQLVSQEPGSLPLNPVRQNGSVPETATGHEQAHAGEPVEVGLPASNEETDPRVAAGTGTTLGMSALLTKLESVREHHLAVATSPEICETNCSTDGADQGVARSAPPSSGRRVGGTGEIWKPDDHLTELVARGPVTISGADPRKPASLPVVATSNDRDVVASEQPVVDVSPSDHELATRVGASLAGMTIPGQLAFVAQLEVIDQHARPQERQQEAVLPVTREGSTPVSDNGAVAQGEAKPVLPVVVAAREEPAPVSGNVDLVPVEIKPDLSALGIASVEVDSSNAHSARPAGVAPSRDEHQGVDVLTGVTIGTAKPQLSLATNESNSTIAEVAVSRPADLQSSSRPAGVEHMNDSLVVINQPGTDFEMVSEVPVRVAFAGSGDDERAFNFSIATGLPTASDVSRSFVGTMQYATTTLSYARQAGFDVEATSKGTGLQVSRQTRLPAGDFRIQLETGIGDQLLAVRPAGGSLSPRTVALMSTIIPLRSPTDGFVSAAGQIATTRSVESLVQVPVKSVSSPVTNLATAQTGGMINESGSTSIATDRPLINISRWAGASHAASLPGRSDIRISRSEIAITDGRVPARGDQMPMPNGIKISLAGKVTSVLPVTLSNDGARPAALSGIIYDATLISSRGDAGIINIRFDGVNGTRATALKGVQITSNTLLPDGAGQVGRTDPASTISTNGNAIVKGDQSNQTVKTDNGNGVKAESGRHTQIPDLVVQAAKGAMTPAVAAGIVAAIQSGGPLPEGFAYENGCITLRYAGQVFFFPGLDAALKFAEALGLVDSEDSGSELGGTGTEERTRYVVKEGDTVDSIAERELADIRYADLIITINRSEIIFILEEGERVPFVYPGQILWLPDMGECRVFRKHYFDSKFGKCEKTGGLVGSISGGKPSRGDSKKTRALDEMEGDRILKRLHKEVEDYYSPRAQAKRKGRITSAKHSGPLAAKLDRLRFAGGRDSVDLNQYPDRSSSRNFHQVAHGDTLLSIAVNHPEMGRPSFWKLIARVNGITTEIDRNGNPVLALVEGQFLLMPTSKEIDQFRLQSITPQPYMVAGSESCSNEERADQTRFNPTVITSDVQIKQYAPKCRLMLIDCSSSEDNFRFALQVAVKGEWRNVASYESQDGQAVRITYGTTGVTSSLVLNLPSSVIREMATSDFDSNWKELLDAFLANEKPITGDRVCAPYLRPVGESYQKA